MTRPKVPAELRQRTAQACESCKRRKQKCNGLCPCNTCTKRKFTCIYADRDNSPTTEDRPSKKRAVGDGTKKSQDERGQSRLNSSSPKAHRRSDSIAQPPTPSQNRAAQGGTPQQDIWQPSQANSVPQQSSAADPAKEGPSGDVPHHATAASSAHDEEAVVFGQSRMLQDPTGRLLYVGDSATLSFLQLLRLMVENVAGDSPFTNDPNRHKIIESQLSLPFGSRQTNVLPDRATAQILVDAFFVNTHGLTYIFEHSKFMQELERCYQDPLATEPSWLCLLNLVFAIGLTMATPMSGSAEALVIEKLRSEHVDRAQMFYLNAKSLNDPIIGLEDQDFWAVQGLMLRAIYMMVKSKRNWAYSLVGMAARAGQALGLHREETMIIFSAEEQKARRNLWRSIFVLDRFLACSLGRPTAISEDDCSGDTLNPPMPGSERMLDSNSTLSPKDIGEASLESAVRSSSTIGLILKKVYQQRKIGTRLAQEIADICKGWPAALPPMLHWRRAGNASPSQGVAILHVNMFYCHSIILLTRPFFLYILNMETQRQMSQPHGENLPPRPYLKMEKFSEACVIASTHTVLLVQNAFDAGYLSRRNPVVIYFLFAAALVILANEFAGLYTVDTADACIYNAITLMSYCAESDQWASRLTYIMISFRDVAAMQKMRRTQSGTQNNTQADLMNLPSISSQLFNGRQASNPPNPTPTPRLHQVPIHIYPGMQTGPMTPDMGNLGTPGQNRAETEPQQDAGSMHLSPLQGFPEAPAGGTPEPFVSTARGKPTSLSCFLDLPALEATSRRVPSLHSEESFGPDEQIDFDALWAWPSNTPAVGSPRVAGEDALNAMVQGVSDSAVPLYGYGEMGPL